MRGVDVDPKLHQALVEAAPDAIVVVDHEGTIALVNQHAERLFGWPRAELVGRSVEVLVPARFRERHGAHRLRSLADPGARPVGGRALVALRKDGEEVPVEVFLSHVAAGSNQWVAASVRDVSDRQRIQRTLEQTTQYLAAVVQECPVGLLLVRDRGKRVEANAEAEHLLGTPIVAEHGVAQFAGRLFWPDGTQLTDDERPSSRALRGERVDACEIYIRRADGTKTPALVNASPLTDELGNVHGAVVAFEDITALKDLERLRVEWNAIVAHDLRQPLNTIALFAQLAQRAGKDDPEVSEPIAQIMTATASLNRMIQDLLDLSRLEAHQLALRKRDADLGEIVTRCVRVAEPAAPTRRFDLLVEKVLPRVLVDPGRMEQIVQNLLTNAIKYSAEASPISVVARRRAEDVEVSVTNEGAGIPPEALPKLFQRFQRAVDGALAEVKGVGLGLYITRELVEAHGGRIYAESTPGGTTTFTFTLPVAPSEAAR